MTFFESNDSSAFEADGVSMEIWEPDLIVLPIPENRASAFAPLRLRVCVTNNTTIPFLLNRYGICIPELVTTDGQSIQRQLVTNQQGGKSEINWHFQPEVEFIFTRFISNVAHQLGRSEPIDMNYWWPIMPRWHEVRPLTARLYWHNNQLQLEFPTTYFKLARPDSFWLFDALNPGTYQLRFIYNSSTDIKPGSERETWEVPTSQEMGASQLVTPFVNFRMVQPLEADSSAVEVDDIRFETIVPRMLTLPEKKPDVETRVPLGISITNNTLTPFRFSSNNTLTPELVGEDGKTVRGRHGSKNLRLRKADFPLVMPGENVTFFTDAKFFWHEHEQFLLSIETKTGDYSIFENLNPGTYQVRFTYSNKNTITTIFDGGITDTELVEGLWISRVSTPFVEFRLI